MTEKTKYAYQKRIKYLKDRNSQLVNDCIFYRNILSDIHGVLVSCLKDGQRISHAWLFEKLRTVWRQVP